MDFLKKIIKGKKSDRHFKKAGTGYSLADDAPIRPQQQPSGSYVIRNQPPPVTAQRVAISNSTAEAATRRLQEANGGKTETAHQRKIRELARKQLEEEMEAERKQFEGITIDERDTKEFEHSSAIEGVYFTCDLFEDDIFLPKSQMVEQVEAFLRTKLNEEGAQVAAVMIHSLNDMEKRDNAISTLDRILKNIINNPTEEKFRRIKMSGKVFNETVKPAKGAIEFLLTLGFKEELENNETFLVLTSVEDERRTAISLALEMLTSEDCRVPLRLYRNTKIYKINPNQPLPKIDVPKDFFTISGSEVKAEQQRKTQEASKLTELRTREMREKDAQAWKYTYKYTLIRIRFPNNYILEGTFGVHENFAALREFVSEHLGIEFGVFHLTDPVHGGVILDNDQKSLGDYRLVPAAMLMFNWDEETVAQFASLNMQVTYLSPESEKNSTLL
uniref:UBX domain-containing protein n=1 Tax=Acrobeloides nanus TaxID=290746 RepID=A0A914CGZ4_9BILA